MLKKLYILSLVAMLVACSKQGEAVPEIEAPTAISFGVSDATSRAATLIGSADVEAFRAEPFSVYGDWIDQNGTRREVFRDVKVSYTTSKNAPTGWIYDPVKYWQMQGSYEFRAYWPASSVVLGTATAQTLALEYNMLSRNDDMMVAYVHCPTKNGGKHVGLNFHHTMAAVAVKLQAPDTNFEYRLKNMFFTSLNYIGALPYNSTSTTPDVTREWVFAEGARSYVDSKDIMASERLREWKSTEGRLIPTSADDYPTEFDLFLPQSLKVGAGIAPPSITLTVEVTWTTVDDITMTIALPTTDSKGNEMVWQAGKKYIYVITVQPDEFDIEVRTTEWDDVDAVVGDIIF